MRLGEFHCPYSADDRGSKIADGAELQCDACKTLPQPERRDHFLKPIPQVSQRVLSAGNIRPVQNVVAPLDQLRGECHREKNNSRKYDDLDCHSWPHRLIPRGLNYTQNFKARIAAAVVIERSR